MTTKKNTTPYVDRALNALFYWERNPKGEVGIEIEVEGGPWPEGAATNWITHVDNSLRNGGIEYIIRQPVMRDGVQRALGNLRTHLAQTNKVFSYRTSVHVHVNVQDLTLRQWTNYIALFCIFEELLVNVIGPERAGNKFCLRFKDADESLRALQRGIVKSMIPDVIAGDFKYASCNLRATASHGTLEFRAMRGNLDVDFITAWVDVLMALKDAARKAQDPTVFIRELSVLGPLEFARKYLPANNMITQGVLNQFDILNNSMYEGARLVQDVAYCLEWGDPTVDVGPSLQEAPVEVEPDIDAIFAAEAVEPVFRAPPIARVMGGVAHLHPRDIDVGAGWADWALNHPAIPRGIARAAPAAPPPAVPVPDGRLRGPRQRRPINRVHPPLRD